MLPDLEIKTAPLAQHSWAIPAYTVQVWHWAFADPVWPQHVPKLLALLNAQEQQRLHALRRPPQQQAFVLTRALCRLVLSQYVPSMAPSDWCFGYNAHGRPALVGQYGLDFNIAHTRSHGLVAVAAPAHSLGVDLESLHASYVQAKVVASFFAASEQAALWALPPEQQPEHLIELWALKEAYIKARGLGLSMPLNSFGVAVPHTKAGLGPWPAVLTSTPLSDNPQHWHLMLDNRQPQHKFALCVRQLEPLQPWRVLHLDAQSLLGLLL